ncbi:hypothetical protein U9M48_008028 [Paspalum notatum var. saurae]|uniref:DNA topoisomerase (ATP-hydrolyzing) n=1 Tax=Paspalum notatum var. saurae TaxID=547442 RepID=A0AAQ3WCH3_PASNO
MTDTCVDLESSSAYSSATAEGGETPRERIILQPQKYIGSIDKRTQKMWVCKVDSLAQRTIFSENMGKKSEPQITVCLQGVDWTRIIFKPDLAKFHMTHLDDDVIALMRKRVLDMAGLLGITVQFSFVNKFATTEGGTHVDFVLNHIAQRVAKLGNKLCQTHVEECEVKKHLWIFVNVVMENPTFNSPIRDALTMLKRNCIASTPRRGVSCFDHLTMDGNGIADWDG